MKPLLIAQKMTEIDDRFILGSIPPTVSAAKSSRLGGLSRFLNSGLGAAVISGIVALGVLVAVIMAGQTDPKAPPANTDAPPVIESAEGESELDTEPVTETEAESESESETEIVMTPEEVEARKDELIAILDALDYKWNILNDPSYYFDQYIPVKKFGKYAVPYMLEYIMEHEGETDPEELKRLGVILHFAYHNMGITEVNDWVSENSIGALDVFQYAEYLMEHLEEHGFPSDTDSSETSEGNGAETGAQI